MGKNISKLFYKDYYNGVNFNYVLNGGEPSGGSKEAIRMINRAIKNAEWMAVEELKELCTHRLHAKIAYPGLVTGIGLVHGSKKLEGAFNLGMHFDYTTGMPVVYGSSVKGVLKSYFEDFCAEAGMQEVEWIALKKEIFDGKRSDNTNISVYERDVFFDAVVVGLNQKGHFLEDDVITPHTGGPLKNPIPIAMLKIASGCMIEFRFRLHDSKCMVNGKTYGAGDKLSIFKNILETVGVGGKTNVGYGQFLSVSVK